MRDLIYSINTCSIGCNIGGLYVNILAYADTLLVNSRTIFEKQLRSNFNCIAVCLFQLKSSCSFV